MIKVGDAVPNTKITVIDAEGENTVSAQEYFSGKKAVLFAVPGAFTPTCSNTHMPGYVVNVDEIKAKGVDTVACLSVNDSFVMKAWQADQNAEHIAMVADGSADLTKALGLEMDTGPFGGVRSQRYSMIIDNGVVSQLNVEKPKEFEVSDAKTILSQLS
jgi:peroxiredoxin